MFSEENACGLKINSRTVIIADERHARIAETGGLHVSRRALFDQEIVRVRGHRLGQFVSDRHGRQRENGRGPSETTDPENAGGKSGADYGVRYGG